MKLYQFPWGIYPRRILVYLKEKGITNIELVEMDIVGGATRTPEFLKKNPAGTIPVLETDDGSFVCQSTTILQYLEEQYPAPNMSGTSAEERARTHDQLMVVGELYNLAGICTYHGSPLFAQRREQSKDAARALRFEYARMAESLEAISGDGPYLGGENPNIADVAFFASEQFMRDLYKLAIPSICTKLEAIYRRFLARPSAAPAPYPQFVIDNAPLREF